MKMNSDRQTLINLNKNNIYNCEIKNKYNSNQKTNKTDKYNSSQKTDKNDKNDKNDKIDKFNSNNKIDKNDKNNNTIKQSNSFNYREVKLNKNGVIKMNNNINNNTSLRERINKQKSKDRKTINSRKSKEKKNINNYNKDNHKNYTNINLLNRIVKTEINKNNMNRINNFKNTSDNKLNRKTQENNSKKLKNKKNFYLKNTNENLTFNNNEGNKITTIESLDDIDITGKQYIVKSKNKNEIQNNNITSNITTTLFSINSTELNEIDINIYEKNKDIKNVFNTQLKDKKDNNNINENVANHTVNQLDIKNNYIKLIDYYSLLNHKLLRVHNKNLFLEKKCNIFREKLFNELKKKNILEQKQSNGDIQHFMNENNHSTLNEKFIRQMLKLKKSEFKIYQNIFNSFYYDYDILKWKEHEKNKKIEEGLKIDLLLVVFKNLIKNYGNVSQIYSNDKIKSNNKFLIIYELNFKKLIA